MTIVEQVYSQTNKLGLLMFMAFILLRYADYCFTQWPAMKSQPYPGVPCIHIIFICPHYVLARIIGILIQ